MQRANPDQAYERIWAVVPLVGAGTATDPKRPMFSDLPGILAYKMEISDNGRLALVEFVAKDRRVFKQLQDSRLPDVLSFDRGPGRAQQILTEFRRHKRNFRLEGFSVAVP